MKTIIVHHHNCHDGVSAAWVALQKHPAAELYPGKYDEPPDLDRLRGNNVIIVDFSWKRPAMLDVHAAAAHLLVIDHHRTAEAELADAPFSCVFDMNRSGAGLAWDVLMAPEPRPRLIDYVEDRDLFRFALPHSREVHAACSSYPLDIETRAWLMKQPIEALATDGAAILRYHRQLVASVLEYRTRAVIAWYDVPCVALPVVSMASDVGHELAKGEAFSATYRTRSDGSRVFSLRSADDGVDVSEIAKLYGGGGHRRAAGFTLEAGVEL